MSNSPSSNPLISIIMAVKDTAPYLDECLSSIIDQSYTNWELIAVNDHSADHSLEILQQYEAKDSRIKVINGRGKMVIATLKEAYSYAHGSLISRMDSDDIMPNYKLQSLHDEWRKHGIGTVITGNTKHFTTEGNVGNGLLKYDAWLSKLSKHNSHYQEIYKECCIQSNCWLIHRSDFEKAGGFEPETYPEDYDLCFRFYKAKLKVIGLNMVLHHWRDRADRISRTLDEYKDNRFFELKVKYFYELDRDIDRPLVLWGAGKNGKDLAKVMLENEVDFHWVCDNDNKIGKDIYDIRMEHYQAIESLNNPQIIIAVAAPEGKLDIMNQLDNWGKKVANDYWFFM